MQWYVFHIIEIENGVGNGQDAFTFIQFSIWTSITKIFTQRYV